MFPTEGMFFNSPQLPHMNTEETQSTKSTLHQETALTLFHSTWGKFFHGRPRRKNKGSERMLSCKHGSYFTEAGPRNRHHDVGSTSDSIRNIEARRSV